MISRINRTGRKRIHKRDIDLGLRVAERGEAPIFDLTLRLADYGFPAEARVRVEAWRSNASQRWDYGTVGYRTPPPDEERRLTDVPAGASFRVFVVAADGSGKLLGHAPNLRPVLPLDSRLPLEESDALGEEVWRVEFDGADGNPVLKVNSAIPGISESVRRDPAFRSLVMPEVFRTILTRMALIDHADPDDMEGPWADWYEIARAYLPDAEPPYLPPTGPVDADGADGDRVRQWIDAVVGAMAEKPLDAANAYREALA